MSWSSAPYMHINAKMFPGKQITSQAITTFTVNIFDEEQQDASSDAFWSMFRCFFVSLYWLDFVFRLLMFSTTCNIIGRRNAFNYSGQKSNTAAQSKKFTCMEFKQKLLDIFHISYCCSNTLILLEIIKEELHQQKAHQEMN